VKEVPAAAEPFACLKRMSQGASSSSGVDPPWLQNVRARNLAQRADLGAPGAERWKKFAERAQQYRDLPGVAETGPELAGDEHEILRTDLSTGLAFFEPQADTMVVEGRPTQVTYLFMCQCCSSTCPCRALRLHIAWSSSCRPALE